MVEALKAAGMWQMKDFICRRKAKIAEYIVNHPIYELCMGAEWIPGLRRFMQWWDKDIKRE